MAVSGPARRKQNPSSLVGSINTVFERRLAVGLKPNPHCAMSNPTPHSDPGRPSAGLDGETYRQQAAAYATEGKVKPALHAINALIGLGAANAGDWRLAGNILLSVQEFGQAAGALENALALDPGHMECRYNLAVCRFRLGEVSAAIADFRIVAEGTDNPNAWTSLASIIPGCPASDHQKVLEVRQKFAELITPFKLGETWQAETRAAGSRIKIGYVSAFFHRANYMKPVWPLIQGHNRERFEIQLFADDTDASGLAWFHPGPHDVVHFTDGLDNRKLIELIRSQSLDILVDLNGYSAPARLPVLTVRVAAAGVAWFNMYATSGLQGLDWIVGDDLVIRQEEECFYSERVWRLPQCCLSFSVGHEAPPVVPQPCLEGRAFTFGSLVSQYKITPEVLDAWSAILLQAPAARLVMSNRTLSSNCNRYYLLRQFTSRGIDGERITFLPSAEHFDFLKHYDGIDLALDAFPYNGGTTTTESLWQGVPVLTTAGDRWASRTSRTLLVHAGLSEFVMPDVPAFIEAAVRWATEPAAQRALASLRQSMRSRLLHSPICQTGTMVKAMEDFYLEISATRTVV
jgi:protein O-GlcNAc transferase